MEVGRLHLLALGLQGCRWAGGSWAPPNVLWDLRAAVGEVPAAGDLGLKDEAGTEAGPKSLARHARAGWDDLALWKCPSEIWPRVNTRQC